jgi:hypothetical protein
MRRADQQDVSEQRRGKRIYCLAGEWFYRTREGKRGPFSSEMALRADMLAFIGTMEFLDEKGGELPHEIDPDDVTYIDLEAPRY